MIGTSTDTSADTLGEGATMIRRISLHGLFEAGQGDRGRLPAQHMGERVVE